MKPRKLSGGFSFVTPIPGEVLRFHVASRTYGDVSYMVDLAAFKFNGACTCDDFQFRWEPKLRAGATPGDATRCWHLRAARNYLLDAEILPKLAARINGDGLRPGRKLGRAGKTPQERTWAQRRALNEGV